jgi:hypothetical protein
MNANLIRCRGQPPPLRGLVVTELLVLVFVTWLIALPIGAALMTWLYWRWTDGLDLDKIIVAPAVKYLRDAWDEAGREIERENQRYQR